MRALKVPRNNTLPWCGDLAEQLWWVSFTKGEAWLERMRCMLRVVKDSWEWNIIEVFKLEMELTQFRLMENPGR